MVTAAAQQKPAEEAKQKAAAEAAQKKAAEVAAPPPRRSTTLPRPSTQTSEDSDEAICRIAAAALVKYKKFKRIEHCRHKGVDMANRDGAMLNIYDVKQLAAYMHQIGFDPKSC